MNGALVVAFALGGGAGAVARYAVSLAVPTRFPWATLVVNVAGSLLLGVGLVALADPGGPGGLLDAPAGRCFVGFCGGFTTFSSFAHGTLALRREASAATALLNVVLNLAGSVGAFVVGAALAGHVAGPAEAFAPGARGTWRELDCIAMTSAELDRATWFGTGAGAATCGLVTVPAERDVPDGRALQVAVYRVPSTSPSPAADPIVYLEGGPGGAGVSLLASLYDPAAVDSVAFLRGDREVIVIDQRGTGYSRPALYCPEVYAAQADGDDEVAAHRACRDRHVAAGVRFADYDSRESAADLETVRRALGIGRWNLYGLSYGTRLALTAMRDAPARLRAVVLDSTFPVEVNGFGDEAWTSIDALHRIEATGVGAAKIEAGMRRLESTPLPAFAAPDYLELLRAHVADPDVGTLVSAVAHDSDRALAARLARLEDGAGWSYGPWPMDDVPPGRYPVEAESADAMYYAVACAEELATMDAPAMPDLSGELLPATRRAVAAGADFTVDARICAVYDVPPAPPIESLAVRSDVPTLVLAGGADVLTPPAWGRRVAAALTRAVYVELPRAPHGVLGNDACATAVTTEFLAAPLAARPEALPDARADAPPDAQVRSLKLAPRPSTGRATDRSKPCSSATWRASASPRPEPPVARVRSAR